MCDEPAETPPKPDSPALAHFWGKYVYELATLPSRPPLESAERERHEIFLLLTMALVHRFWNGNKNGPVGDYPWRTEQKIGLVGGEAVYRGAERKPAKGEPVSYDFDYLGHNIAAIAVDKTGKVIDFEFNHNEILDSSVEHAESRLIRRVFSLAQVDLGWNMATAGAEKEKLAGREYSTNLSDVTVYTSLEPCAQCAGIMALAQVKTLVYLQTDPGMYRIGNILYRLTNLDDSRLRSPLPISARELGLVQAEELEDGFRAFVQGVGRTTDGKRPFFRRTPTSAEVVSPSITSYLCTDHAWRIFESAAAQMRGMSSKDNAHVLAQARHFLEYASALGERATPHKL